MSPRRRMLALAAVGVGAALAWRGLARPEVPALEARRRHDLVVLETPGDADLSRSLGLGVVDRARPPVAPVDRAAVESADAANILGNEGPPLVAFLDYRCGACRQHAEALLAAARAGRARLLVREWPILGAPSVLAARAALAAGMQGAYWQLHAALMTTPFVPNDELIDALAARAGLERSRLWRDMTAPAVDRILARNDQLARGLGGVGTPLYVVDGVVVTGGWTPDVLLALAQRHRL